MGGGAALILALLVGGCGKTGNLFAFTHKSDVSSTTDVVVLLADAAAATEAGDHVAAEALFAKAVEQNPQSSEARIGVVNAVTKQIQQQGLDLLSLTKNVSNQNGAPMLFGMVMGAPANARAGYYLFDQTALETKYKVKLSSFISLYTVMIKHLGEICVGNTDIKLKDVPSIYFANVSFAYLLRGVIRCVDSTGDGVLDYAVYYDETLKKYQVFLSSDTGRTNPVTTVNFNKSAALNDLTYAIDFMNLAKAASKDSAATLWTSIVELLTKAKTMINDLSA